MRTIKNAPAVASTNNPSTGDGRGRHRSAGGEGTKGHARVLISALALFLTASFAHEARTASAASIWLAQGETKVDFNIPKQSLADALAAWSKQSGLQVLRRDTDGADLTASSVNGKLSPAEALTKMLAATGLTYEFVNDRTVRIAPARSSAQTTSFSRGETVGVNLAQADQAMQKVEKTEEQSSSEKTEPSKDSTESWEGESSSSKGIPEVLVKGSRSLNVDIRRSEEDIQPYQVFSKEDIQRSGVSDIESFLKRNLNANSALTSTSQSAGSTNGNATTFSLRGLPASETLILINGRRAPSYNVSGIINQPDLGGVPLAAIERIEVLSSTASGIFGGGATGGVINVVLKRNYSGLDIASSFENPFKGNAARRNFSIDGGFSPDGGRTSISVSASFADTSPLYVEDREFSRTARELGMRNVPTVYDVVAPLGATTNITSTTVIAGVRQNLTLKSLYGGASLGTTRTYIPYGYSGVASDSGAALIANAGRYNFDYAPTAQAGGGGRQSLLNNPTIKSAATTIRRSFGERVEAFSEFSISRNSGRFENNVSNSTFSLPATAASNPFEQAIRITVPGYGLDGYDTSKITNRYALAGTTIRLAGDWHLEAEYSWSSSEMSAETTDSATFTTTLRSAVNSGTVNLMRDTNLFPVDFSSYVTAAYIAFPSTSSLQNPSLRLGGTLPISLPGGKPSLTALAEYRELNLEDLYADFSSSFQMYYPSRRQATRSLYLESRIPLISELNSMPGIELLEFQVATRYDRYSTLAAESVLVTAIPAPINKQRQVLSSFDPTIGFKYQPVFGVMFRASYATGFVPPSVTDLVPQLTQPLTVSQLAGWVDPRRANEPVFGSLTQQGGGDPGLRPEEARSWTAGVVLTPSLLPGLRISLDRTTIRKRDNFGSVFGQELIDLEDHLPGRVLRAVRTPQNDPTGYGVGPITGFVTSIVNLASLDVKSWDMALDYRLSTERFGQGMLSLNGTRNDELLSQATPNTTPVDRLGLSSGSLRWIASARLDWELGKWSAGWSTQFYDEYWVNTSHTFNINQGSAIIPGQVYHDLHVGFTGEFTGGGSESSPRVAGLLQGLSIRAGVLNVFNTRPPLVVADTVGYSRVADPRLARYYININKHFGGN